MANTLFPDTDDTTDILVSAIGGAVGLLCYAYLATSKSSPLPSLGKQSKLYGVASAGFGVVAGHKLYEHIADEREKRNLLGG